MLTVLLPAYMCCVHGGISRFNFGNLFCQIRGGRKGLLLLGEGVFAGQKVYLWHLSSLGSCLIYLMCKKHFIFFLK